MIHLTSCLYTQITNLPEDEKKEMVKEGVKAISRIALAVMGTLFVQRLQLGSVGLGVAVLVGAELSLPAAILAVGCAGSYKLFSFILADLSLGPKAAHISIERRTMLAALPAFPIFLSTNIFAHGIAPLLSVGVLENHVIEPLADCVADWVI